MQKIEAHIQPFKLEEVKEALLGVGIQGISITEILGHGRQKGHTERYRGAEYQLDLIPKIKLEIFVADPLANQVVNTIMTSARTGKIGDGKVFVIPVAEAVRIRNGERSETAL